MGERHGASGANVLQPSLADSSVLQPSLADSSDEGHLHIADV